MYSPSPLLCYNLIALLRAQPLQCFSQPKPLQNTILRTHLQHTPACSVHTSFPRLAYTRTPAPPMCTRAHTRQSARTPCNGGRETTSPSRQAAPPGEKGNAGRLTRPVRLPQVWAVAPRTRVFEGPSVSHSRLEKGWPSTVRSPPKSSATSVLSPLRKRRPENRRVGERGKTERRAAWRRRPHAGAQAQRDPRLAGALERWD